MAASSTSASPLVDVNIAGIAHLAQLQGGLIHLNLSGCSSLQMGVPLQPLTTLQSLQVPDFPNFWSADQLEPLACCKQLTRLEVQSDPQVGSSAYCSPAPKAPLSTIFSVLGSLTELRYLSFELRGRDSQLLEVGRQHTQHLTALRHLSHLCGGAGLYDAQDWADDALGPLHLLPKLRHLSLPQLVASSMEPFSLPAHLIALSHLRHLQLEVWACSTRSIVPLIARHMQLTSLQLHFFMQPHGTDTMGDAAEDAAEEGAHGPNGPGGWSDLAHLGGSLRKLSLRLESFSDDVVSGLVHLTHLHTLAVDCSDNNTSWSAFARCVSQLLTLEDLQLSPLRPQPGQAYTSTWLTPLTRLTRLVLNIYESGHLLPEIRDLTNLRHLSYAFDAPWVPDSFDRLSRLTNLEQLSLVNHTLTSVNCHGQRTPGGNPGCLDSGSVWEGLPESLLELAIKSPDIRDDGLRRLARLGKLTKLTLLSCTQLTGSGLEAVAKLTRLRELSLVQCPNVGDEGLLGMASKGAQHGLLQHGAGGMDPVGAGRLLTLGGAPAAVDGCTSGAPWGLPVDVEGGEERVGAGGVPDSLQTVHLSFCSSLTHAGVVRFRELCRGVHVEFQYETFETFWGYNSDYED